MEKIQKQRCYQFPFCWRTVVGYIERKFVTTTRFLVCEKHGESLMKSHEEASWAGQDWHSQEFIKFNP